MDSLSSTNSNCQVGSNGSRMMSQNGTSATSNGPSGPVNSAPDVRQTYTIPGIVQFLQYEWQRFEMHRQQWEVEKSELQARIALLQGERKGQENLKNDLIRRIKMLEYCLRQERAKFHKLKYGVDPPSYTNSPDDLNDEFNNLELDENMNSDGQNSVNWKQGRQLLRHYLQEIGYTDTIIDVRSNRVRSLLGLSNLNEELTSEQAANKILTQSKLLKSKAKLESMNPSSMLVNDAESSVLATFEFLNNQSDGMIEGIKVEDDDYIDNNEPGSVSNDETEEVLNEFDLILNNRMDLNEHDLTNWKSNVTKEVDIGELASLTETNNVIDCNTTVNTEVRKTWSQKYILKSHYDCIRSLRFHATEPLLITASEDETLKLWNLNKPQPSKSKQQINTVNATLDLEPVYTYRGHSSRVLSLCVNGNTFYSGSQNGEIIAWSIPANIMNIDPYDPYDAKLQLNNTMAHKDAIWSLAPLTSSATNSQILCSASADGAIKIWDATRLISLIKTIDHDEGIIPTDLYVIGSPNLNTNVSSSPLLISSCNDGSISLYDIEGSSSPVLSFEKVPSSGIIYSLAVHPTMPIVISAHQDRHIRLWDINTGKCIHSMVAHLDEVTSVDCDPNGLYLLSGSHDCSVRLWNFDNKNCVQEITSHRKKFGEAIFDVTFHPSKPYFASAGADALAKVFV